MGSKKILIIDDDDDFVESTRVVLESGGYSIRSASTKEEGFELIESSCPDLIILDVIMEKMSDGFDLSRKIKSDEKYKMIPIFMVTSVGNITGFKYSSKAGDDTWLPVDDYAEKPLNPEDLLKRVKKLLLTSL